MQASLPEPESCTIHARAWPVELRQQKKPKKAIKPRTPQPKRECKSRWYVEDVTKGLYLLKEEVKDIESCLHLTDSVIVRLLWHQFGRFEVCPVVC